jgi:hypothetical protein
VTARPTSATAAPARSAGRDAPASQTHALLCDGVPLSLLLDLADPQGPHSEELYLAETGHLPRSDR